MKQKGRDRLRKQSIKPSEGKNMRPSKSYKLKLNLLILACECGERERDVREKNRVWM